MVLVLLGAGVAGLLAVPGALAGVVAAVRWVFLVAAAGESLAVAVAVEAVEEHVE